MRDGTILLVEDNEDDEKLTLRAFKKNGIANPVHVARDGQEALDYLAEDAHPAPAIVLLDLRLPKVSGLDVLRAVRAEPRLQLVPVIILTSSKEEQDVITGYKLGCNSYVRKPVNFEQFTEAARQLGLYWLLLNEPPPAVAP